MSNDPDREYFVGCSVAAVVGLAVLLFPVALCLIDSFGSKAIYTTTGLTKLFVASIVFSSISGFLGARFGGIPAAFGSMGGFCCGSAYWFMHLQQSIAKAPADIGIMTEYQDSTMFIVPISWLAIGAIASFLPLIKNPRLKREE